MNCIKTIAANKRVRDKGSEEFKSDQELRENSTDCNLENAKLYKMPEVTSNKQCSTELPFRQQNVTVEVIGKNNQDSKPDTWDYEKDFKGKGDMKIIGSKNPETEESSNKFRRVLSAWKNQNEGSVQPESCKSYRLVNGNESRQTSQEEKTIFSEDDEDDKDNGTDVMHNNHKNNINNSTDSKNAIPVSCSLPVSNGATSNTGKIRIMRTSATIKQIQEKLRTEQLKDMGGKNYRETSQLANEIAGKRHPLHHLARADAVAAVKNARRQRSRSRTKYGKMKCDQLYRPYRRWLGVSTCVASDVRFIVEPGKTNNQSSPQGNDKERNKRTKNLHAKLKRDEVNDEMNKPDVENSFDDSDNSDIDAQTASSNNATDEDGLSKVKDENSNETKEPRTGYKQPCKEHRGKQLRFSETLDSTCNPPTTKSDITRSISENDNRYIEGNVSHKGHYPQDAISPHEEGGLAGNIKCEAKFEFNESQKNGIPVSTRDNNVNGKKESLTSELKALTEQKHPGKKKSTLKSLKSKMKKSQEKATYLNVRAIRDSEGRLPGQLTFKKGQVIKQMDIGQGLSPTDGMFYGYYRTGKLRRKVWGIYPCTHVTTYFESSDSETDIVGQPKVERKNKTEECGK